MVPFISPDDYQATGRHRGLPRVLQALEHANFRLLWTGQLVRGTSLWLQFTAVPLLVLQLGGSAIDLGIIVALQFGPVLVLGPIGGVLADRLDKRRALIRLQVILTLIAIVLASATMLDVVTIAYAMALSAIFGLANAAEMPIRQSFLAELVPRDRLPNAIVLQQAAFNSTRLIGPAAAGILIALLGFGLTFAIASLFNVIAALLLIRMDSRYIKRHSRPDVDGLIRSLAVGLRYAAGTRGMRDPLTVLLGTSLFAFGVIAVLPLFAVEALDLDSRGYGILLASFGAGGVLGAAPMAFIRPRHLPRSIPLGLAGVSACLIVLGAAWDPAIAYAAMTLMGMSAIVVFGSTNMLVQLSLEDRLRGRVMGLYVATFSGGSALGGLIAAMATEQLGVRSAFIGCAAGTGLVALWALATIRVRPAAPVV